MMDDLYFLELFKQYEDRIDEETDCIVIENKSGFIFTVNSEYALIEILFDFDTNTYKVDCSMDREQYMQLYMCNEDEIDEDDFSFWNIRNIYNNSKRAFEKFTDIIESLNNECEGIFGDAMLELISTNINMI